MYDDLTRETFRSDLSILADLEQSWRSLAPKGGVPLRAQVSAVTMGRALPYGFILERIAPGHARFRVAGRKISDLIGVEARGMPISALFDASARKILCDRLELAFTEPAIIDLPLQASQGFARNRRVLGRMLILPLSNAEGEVTRAMGALVMDAASTMRPRRLGIRADAPYRCETVMPGLVQPQTRPVFSTVQGGVRLSSGATRPTGQLRLVVSN